VKSFIKTFQIDFTLAVGSVIRFARLPVSATIKHIVIGCDALTGLSKVNVGIYKVKDQSQADDSTEALDDNQYANEISLVAASKNISGVSAVAVQNANLSILSLYEALNPDAKLVDKFADVALTLKTAATASGYVSVKVEYV
jgi:hypothetical protein